MSHGSENGKARDRSSSQQAGADVKGTQDADAGDAAQIIELLKKRLGTTTDQDLAEALKVGRSTVANWRRRDSVPSRYSALVNSDTKARLDAAFSYDLLSREERAAFSLAIMRMHRGWLAELDDYKEFLRRGGFIPVQVTSHVEKALLDLLAEMDRGDYEDPFQCVNAMVFAEFFS